MVDSGRRDGQSQCRGKCEEVKQAGAMGTGDDLQLS